jgi:hypothetical protein
MQFTKFNEAMITNLSDSASPFRREIPRSHWFVSFRQHRIKPRDGAQLP